uniref:Uncharacterized protein n=1 Tax=Arundo donax TaxID=35708 RepID=A0A0A9F4V1_ARUDO
MALRMSELKHPPTQHTLYVATRVRGAMPLAVPAAYPSRSAPWTAPPAAVLDVCVPCPSLSLGDRDSLDTSTGPFAASYPVKKNLAPMSFLLQAEALKSLPSSHLPFHPAGTGPNPVSS